MRRHLISVILLVTMLIASSRTARADDTSEQRQERARALWEEAAAKYDVGRYDDAINLFNAAWDVWPFPPILFGLGQSYRQKKNYERAAFYYRAFLRRDPKAPNRSDVADLIEQMDAMVEQQRQSGKKPPTGAKPGGGAVARPAPALHSDIRPWHADRWGWTIATGGFIVAGVGVAYLVDASLIEQDADAALEFDAPALYEKADRQRSIGTVLTVVGAAGLVVGVIKLAWRDAAPSGNHGTEVAFGLGWIELRGTF